MIHYCSFCDFAENELYKLYRSADLDVAICDECLTLYWSMYVSDVQREKRYGPSVGGGDQ